MIGFKFSNLILLSVAAFLLAVNTSCGAGPASSTSGQQNDSVVLIPESAQAVLASVANYSEQGVALTTSASAPASCASTRTRSACAANVMTVNWNGCTAKSGGTSMVLNGQWQDSYADATTCTAAQAGPLADGQSFTRQSESGVSLVYPGGFTVISDTKAHQTYSGVSIPGSGTTVSQAGGQRTIQIAGLHRRASLGKTPGFDYSVVTTSPISISGTRATKDRTVANGTVTIYHNSSRYTATNKFSAVKWEQPACCFPTSGKISTTFSGSVNGDMTLNFTANCGQALLSSSRNSFQRPVSLSQCE